MQVRGRWIRIRLSVVAAVFDEVEWSREDHRGPASPRGLINKSGRFLLLTSEYALHVSLHATHASTL